MSIIILIILYYRNEKIYTGLKYQCVELARRYLILVKQITFEDVDFAYQIFTLKHFRRKPKFHDADVLILFGVTKRFNEGSNIKDQSLINVNVIKNGEDYPVKDALLIWNDME